MLGILIMNAFKHEPENAMMTQFLIEAKIFENNNAPDWRCSNSNDEC